MEPVVMQYTQQALLRGIVESIDEDDFSKKTISWRHQEPNQRLAFKGSISGSLATLDLSEASDRVSNLLVKAMLKNFPALSGAVQACRSTSADVPGFGVIPLSKFSSMGSALCFPFESMTFMVLIFLGIEKELNTQLTWKLARKFLGRVRTYGDDIIVPSRFAPSVVNTLEAYGFRVNKDKSFWTGSFRESCGKWYFRGTDVTPVRCRSYLPTQRKDAEEIISTVSLRNQFYEHGYWQTVRYLDNILEGIIPFPAVAETSPGLGKMSFLGYETQRMHPDLQKPIVKAARVRAVLPINSVDGHGALLKYFLTCSDLLVTDREHLLRSGRPRSVSITTRWTASY